MTQAEFARRRNVTRQRVSQWVREGKIFGPAITDGLIDEAVACEQLKVRLDISQRLSANGLATNLEASVPPASSPTGLAMAAPFGPRVDTVQELIAQQRLEQLQRQNRAAAVEEAQRAGALVEAAAARRQATKAIGEVMLRIEGSLAELAGKLAAEFKLSTRDVLHFLRNQWREIRAAAAIEARERAEPMPERVGYDLDDQADDEGEPHG